MQGSRKAIVLLSIIAVALSLSTIQYSTTASYSTLQYVNNVPSVNSTSRWDKPLLNDSVGDANGKEDDQLTVNARGHDHVPNATAGSPQQPRPHPHAGARYANGEYGLVADVTAVRGRIIEQYRAAHGSNGLPPSSYLPIHKAEHAAVCMDKPREGRERKAGWRLLTQKVQVDGPDPVARERALATPVGNSTTPRLLCAIYSYEKRHPSVTAIAETWGWRCDGFFAASTKTVPYPQNSSSYTNPPGLGAIDLPHQGPETYQNMWMKTRSILAYMHDNYLEDFDFFFLSGDDTLLIVENLRRTLVSLGVAASEYPLYLGHWIPDGTKGSYYCGGGAGYVLNQKSLKILVEQVLPNCATDFETAAEDRTLGRCFRSVGILGNHSVDGMNAQRFHGMSPHDVCSMKGDKDFFELVYRFWGQHYGFKTGFNLTSTQSVSFHMMRTPKHLKRHHAILYKSCPRNTTIGDLLSANEDVT